MKREKNNRSEKDKETSLGGYIFLGVIIIFVLVTVFFEQRRKYNEKQDMKFGIETVGKVIETNSQKTEFAKYYFKANGRTYYSSRATPFTGILPGEIFVVKYLNENPEANAILYENPVIPTTRKSRIRGIILKIISNNKANYSYTYKNHTYERWQRLRENHSFYKGDSVDIDISTDNPKISMICY